LSVEGSGAVPWSFIKIASISDTPEFVAPNTDPHVSVDRPAAGISLLPDCGTAADGKRGIEEGEAGMSDSTGGHDGRVSGCDEDEAVKGEVGLG